MSHEMILFEKPNFMGRHRHLFTSEPNLGASDDNVFNNNVFSLAVLGGSASWRIFRRTNFVDPYPVALGEGLYSHVSLYNIQGNAVSSIQATGFQPSVNPEPIPGHAILYRLSDRFGDVDGSHAHVFRNVPEVLDLVNYFPDAIAVLQGNWRFFLNPGFEIPFAPVLGPGLHNLRGFTSGQWRSMRPTTESPTVVGQPIGGNLVLHAHPNCRGPHRHFHRSEPDLERHGFNDQASSMAIQTGNWHFFSGKRFQERYEGVALGPGFYPWLPNVGIGNDDMSSLTPVAQPT
jgi:beta/gamma crystallin